MHYQAVIVSPHLDDAVFSCGGEIARLTRGGPVLVLNLFTSYAAEVKVRAVVLGAERYDEERAAAKLLDYESYNFGELDATFRRPPYHSLGNIFRPPVAEDVGVYLDELRARVLGYLETVTYGRLYVPLGVGWHVDHLLTHRIFEPWYGRQDLYFYEDAPYCLLPHATRYRLDELGTYQVSTGDRSLTLTGHGSSWRAASRAYAGTAIMRQLTPWLVRKLAVPAVGFYLYRLMSMHRHHAQRGPHDMAIEAMTVPLGDLFARKLEAMQCYGSQFRAFFSDAEDCARMYGSYATKVAGTGTALERYWQFAGERRR